MFCAYLMLVTLYEICKMYFRLLDTKVFIEMLIPSFSQGYRSNQGRISSPTTIGTFAWIVFIRLFSNCLRYELVGEDLVRGMFRKTSFEEFERLSFPCTRFVALGFFSLLTLMKSCVYIVCIPLGVLCYTWRYCTHIAPLTLLLKCTSFSATTCDLKLSVIGIQGSPQSNDLIELHSL